jgi:hypothetical protein
MILLWSESPKFKCPAAVRAEGQRHVTGRRFELRTPTLAIDMIDAKRIEVTIPARTIISPL